MEFDLDPTIAVTAFLAQVGGRHLDLGLTPMQKRVLDQPAVKMAVLLALFFISTRHLLASMLLVATLYLCLYVLFNEHHPYNVLPRSWVAADPYLARPNASATGASADPVRAYTERMRERRAHAYRAVVSG